MNKYSGIEYLKVDVANQYGIKGTFAHKIGWVKKQKCLNIELAKTAKHPARFVSAIYALRQVQNKQPIGHLVGLDATASGAQMIAALISCKITAKNTGIIGKTPKDLYQITTDEMGKLLGKKVHIDRATVKSAQMPMFYGSKREPKNVFGDGTDEYHAFYEAQETVAPGAVRFMDTVQDFWNPYAEEHAWVMPDGFQVHIPVIQTEKSLIHIADLDEEIMYQTSIVKGTKKGVSLLANITHSVDAYVMREVVRKCDFEMLVIHDEFLGHPNNLNEVRQAYVNELADIADGTLLNGILSQLANEEVIVEKQNKNIGKDIRQSEYAIS